MKTIKFATFAIIVGLGGCAEESTNSLAETGQAVSTATSGSVTATLTTTSDWGTGFCDSVTLVNKGSAVTDWTAKIATNGATIDSIWSATQTTSGTTMTVTPQSYNKSIPSGGSVNFGYCGTGTKRPTLTSITVNGGGGGVGGATATGGSTAKGGATAKGGTTATGGTKATGGTTAKGGTTATGGTKATGGTTAKGGTTAAGGSPPTSGCIKITDPVPGWASMDGGTTGGGTDLSKAITVKSSSELKAAASGNDAKIILVEPGDYGSFSPGSNKTIIGKGPGVKITAPLSIKGQSNIIMRNFTVKGAPCASYEACRAGSDGVYIGSNAHHVWLDHFDISDGQDGNCDITQGGNFVTVSWTKFWYSSKDKEHQFSNLIAGSDNEPASVGKLKITYMNSWWGQMVETRQPRGRYGDVHMLNNLHNSADSRTLHGVGKDMALIAENCVYNVKGDVFTDMGSPRGWKGIGNIGTASGLNATKGSVFTIPYKYTAMPASQVEAAVTATKCGAGNTGTF